MGKKTFLIVILFMGLGLFAGCEGNNGKLISEEPFYSLQAAYNNNFISKEDLKSIASLHKNGNDNALSVETSSEIKTAYLERYPQDGMTADDVVIDKYFGTYNSCVALMIGYTNNIYSDLVWSETIAGVKISYSNSQRIFVWKK